MYFEKDSLNCAVSYREVALLFSPLSLLQNGLNKIMDIAVSMTQSIQYYLPQTAETNMTTDELTHL